jgi:hypothetical protein
MVLVILPLELSGHADPLAMEEDNRIYSALTPPERMAMQSELLSAAPQVQPYLILDSFPIAWESPKYPERKMWSEYTYSVVNQYFDELDEAQDTSHFCKNYKDLSRDKKIIFWAQIFAGISRWESGWDPTNRTIEGTDPDEITGEKSVSEGLLQLSYSDTVNYGDLQTNEPYCPFDWDKDKQLPETDVHRTILNPYMNLYCGIRIMADSIVTNVDKTSGQRKIVYNGYWSTLGAKSFLQNVHIRSPQIRNSTEKLPFCGGKGFIAPSDIMLDVINTTQKAVKRHRQKSR